MSSILKALKKLEEQKAPRPKYEVDLSSGIMRERKVGSQRRWSIPVAMVAIAIAAAVTTYTIMAVQNNAEEKKRHATPISVVPLPPPANQAAELPLSPAVPPAQMSGPVSGSKPNPTAVISAVDQESRLSKHSQKQAEAKDEAKRNLSAVRAAIPVMPSAPPPSPPLERHTIAPPRVPDLKVTGIAWEKDSASRYAVVNGVAVRQGSSVEGVKIEEILPDKVRFTQGTHAFELSLGSLPAAN